MQCTARTRANASAVTFYTISTRLVTVNSCAQLHVLRATAEAALGPAITFGDFTSILHN
jgi:hypothetical protein